MMSRCCLAVFGLLLTCGQAVSQESLQTVLLTQEKKLIEAIKAQDKATLKQMLTEEAYAVTAEGGRQTGAQMLRSLDNVTIARYSISDVEAVQVSPDVGILSYKFTWSGGRDGETLPATTVLATSTWARRDGQWRSVFYQETPIAQHSTRAR